MPSIRIAPPHADDRGAVARSAAERRAAAGGAQPAAGDAPARQQAGPGARQGRPRRQAQRTAGQSLIWSAMIPSSHLTTR